MPHTARAALVVAVLAATATTSASATAQAATPPQIHAHRGGTVVNGKPTYAEETLDAYRNAAKNGFVFEIDAKLTADGTPVAIHDATLDRTTTCTGEVRSFTLQALGACRFDVLGSPGGGLPTRSVKPRGRIATIAEVLELAGLTGAKVNLEIKNLPTDPDYDPTPAYANKVMDVVIASGLDRSQVLIQSFIPANLDAAKQALRGVATSLLTLPAGAAEIEVARDKGYTWLSPQWPFAAAFVRDAHRAHKLVAPYTLNQRADVKAAGRAKVDALITDDPLMAAGALGLRPVNGLTAKLTRRRGAVEVAGRLRVPGRKLCTGSVALRVLGANRILRARRAPLKADCTYSVAARVPRGAPARLLATIGFSGNDHLLPRLIGPRPVPQELPRAVPHS
ncbi:MAG: glycerophosphoryl diester phosphodiesterase [Thermoleophilaceae bacterium]|jgi:glycerophosphoryl diester phosphodiesterase|nr:glycerophosphoryl diester phosphodiesterase [Thermoleophilaceae bacterium]